MPPWVSELLNLLFGQLGAVGTVMVGVAAYSAFLLQQEQREHKDTRKYLAEMQERSLEVQKSTIQVLTELKNLLEANTTGRKR